METINDIVDELRRLNDGGFPLDGESSHPLVEDMRLLADRIDKAVTNCNRLKMREALNQLLGLIDNKFLVFCNELEPGEVSHAQYQIDKADAALSAPPRNCDRFANARDALKECEKETGSTVAIDFIKWLFAEAKGEEK